MLDKGYSLSRAKRQSKRFLAMFKSNNRNLATPGLVREGMGDSGPLGTIYSAGVEKLLEFYEDGSRGAINFAGGPVTPVKLSAAQFDAIEAVLERAVSHQIEELEKRIGVLGTLVSLSPFCGLFGTVWGVMMAFCGIAAAGKADFTALAPGVAGALLTTVAGLVVAIPSLVGYNLLTGMIRQLTVQMDNFTEEFLVAVKLSQLKINSSERD
jgi:biopolymer transport protein ExbB/TolQ